MEQRGLDVAGREHVLHGLRHEERSFEHNGDRHRLTNVEGNVIGEALA